MASADTSADAHHRQQPTLTHRNGDARRLTEPLDELAGESRPREAQTARRVRDTDAKIALVMADDRGWHDVWQRAVNSPRISSAVVWFAAARATPTTQRTLLELAAREKPNPLGRRGTFAVLRFESAGSNGAPGARFLALRPTTMP